MGLLDDAIREHLELKRKHGATDEELQRKETEALGPARRDFSPAEPASPEARGRRVRRRCRATRPRPHREPEPRGWLDEDELAGRRRDAGAAPRSRHAPGRSRRQPEPASPRRGAARAGPPRGTAPSRAGEPPPPRRTSDTPTQGFDALSLDDDEPEETEGEDGEDVLEETPDFLQDTPEHDRLWFEQKPPRDFDFDE